MQLQSSYQLKGATPYFSFFAIGSIRRIIIISFWVRILVYRSDASGRLMRERMKIAHYFSAFPVSVSVKERWSEMAAQLHEVFHKANV